MIETAPVELDQSYVAAHPEVSPGPYILLAVSDTGQGMDAETQSRIFEPFFTTKEQGKGTGLGLSTVYGIVKQSGGHISVYSEPGFGASFKIYLPVIDSPDTPESREDASSVKLEGSESIMIIEDDAAVRQLARIALAGYGYSVTAVDSASQAIKAFDSIGGTLNLIVTDVIMPNVSGPKIVEQLRKRKPNLKVLFVSGYTEEATIRHGVLDEGVNFLQKPFTPEGLVKKVREVLDSNV